MSDGGRLQVHEKTHAGKVAAATGAVCGAIMGAIFPPAGVALVTDGLVGGASLGTIGLFADGLSRSDLKALGALLEDGQAAVVAVAVNAVDEDIENTLTHAAKKASKAIDDGDVNAALADLEKGVDKSADKVADDLARSACASAPPTSVPIDRGWRSGRLPGTDTAAPQWPSAWPTRSGAPGPVLGGGGAATASSKPHSRAALTASLRLTTPSFRYADFRWYLTVLTE